MSKKLGGVHLKFIGMRIYLKTWGGSYRVDKLEVSIWANGRRGAGVLFLTPNKGIVGGPTGVKTGILKHTRKSIVAIQKFLPKRAWPKAGLGLWGQILSKSGHGPRSLSRKLNSWRSLHHYMGSFFVSVDVSRSELLSPEGPWVPTSGLSYAIKWWIRDLIWSVHIKSSL